jgi:uncharacterized protein (DUF433 family)
LPEKENSKMKFGEGTTEIFENLVTCDTEIMSGTPVFKNTRVPIKNLIDYLEVGESLDEFLEDFPSVSREQAVQALELAKEMLLTHAHEHSHR